MLWASLDTHQEIHLMLIGNFSYEMKNNKYLFNSNDFSLKFLVQTQNDQ